MKRKTITPSMRRKIFDDAEGKCCVCGNEILDSRWTAEHIKPLWLGGADDPSNIKPAHTGCSISKTMEEAPVRARVYRQRQRHLGIKKPRSMRSWRKFDGTPVYADKER